MKNWIFLFILLAGCSAAKWQNRVGYYTFDNAKQEYGPPDKCETVNSGMVCAWTTNYGRNWIDKLILSFDENEVLIAGGEKRF